MARDHRDCVDNRFFQSIAAFLAWPHRSIHDPKGEIQLAQILDVSYGYCFDAGLGAYCHFTVKTE
jgi:hypothetical protein